MSFFVFSQQAFCFQSAFREQHSLQELSAFTTEASCKASDIREEEVLFELVQQAQVLIRDYNFRLHHEKKLLLFDLETVYHCVIDLSHPFTLNVKLPVDEII